MSKTRVVILDAESARFTLKDDYWQRHLPAGHEALPPLRLSAFNPPTVARNWPDARPVDWPALEAALARLSRAITEQSRSFDSPSHTLVLGLAPLPVLTLMGYDLQRWIGDVRFINRRTDLDFWDVIDIPKQTPMVSVSPFDLRGLPDETAEATGLVALSVWVKQRPQPEAVRAYCRGLGLDLGALVELAPHSVDAGLCLDSANGPAAMVQLQQTLDHIAARFPNRAGLALIVSGPASLAFMAGRALNPRVHDCVHVANWQGAGYEHAFTLHAKPTAGRQGQRPRVLAPTAVLPRVRLLFISSRAPGDRALVPESEARSVEHKIRAASQPGQWQVVQQLCTRPGDLGPALTREQPEIMHFSGHGADFGISLCAADGRQRLVDGDTLALLFGSLTTRVRLVVLNGCNTGEIARALSAVVDCAVGMTGQPTDSEACAFAAAFYAALASGLAVPAAVAQGEAGLRMERHDTQARPGLFVRAGVDASTLVFPSA